MVPGYTYITTDPEILGGKPVISGTRLSVEFILELIASGASVDTIAGQYPSVPVEGIREALMYAASIMKNDTHLFVKITA